MKLWFVLTFVIGISATVTGQASDLKFNLQGSLGYGTYSIGDHHPAGLSYSGRVGVRSGSDLEFGVTYFKMTDEVSSFALHTLTIDALYRLERPGQIVFIGPLAGLGTSTQN